MPLKQEPGLAAPKVYIAYVLGEQLHARLAQGIALMLSRKGVQACTANDIRSPKGSFFDGLREYLDDNSVVFLICSTLWDQSVLRVLEWEEYDRRNKAGELFLARRSRPSSHERRVKLELDFLTNERLNLYVVPVLPPGALNEGIPEALIDRMILDLRGEKEFSKIVELLYAHLELTEKEGRGSKTPPPPNIPTYLHSIKVSNTRCFKEPQLLDLTLPDGGLARWVVLLGENGTGKTTLLQSIAWAIEQGRLPEEWTLPSREGDGPLNIGAELRVGAGIDELARAAQVTSITQRPSNNGAVFRRRPEGVAPGVVYAYGAARRMNPATLKEGEAASPVATLFDPDSDLLNAEEWLMRLDYQVLASQRGEGDDQAAARLELVKKTICALLPDVHAVNIYGPGGQGLGAAKRKTGVWFRTDFGDVRLADVSLGYQTMLAWTVDLASRLFDRYPDEEDPLSQPALVLVDEIDLHLHPSWQRRLLPFLSERFPRVQFIVTAHSPLVVQGSDEAVVAVLRKHEDQVIIDNQPERVRTWRVDQLLTSDLFGLESARPRWVAELMDERTRLVGEGLTTARARERVAEIDQTLGALPTAETPKEQSTLDELREIAAFLRDGAGVDDDSD